MEGEKYSEAQAPKEVSEQPSPAAPTLSTSGQMKMSEPLPPEPAEVAPAPVPTDQPLPPPPPETPVTPITEAKTPPVQTVETQKQPKEIPLPRPDNPETKEVSGSKEVGLGRDDGQAVDPNDPVNDPTAAGRRRIQEALKSTQPVVPTSQPQPTDSAVASSGDTALPPTSISLPVEPTDDLTLPPVSPPLPTDITNPPSNPPPVTIPPSGYQPSDDLIVFRTDYPAKDLGGAADEMNRENADINKANRELFEARAEAKRIEAETGLSIDEYRNQAAYRLAHPEFYDSSNPQEILNSSIPVSPPLPTTAEAIALPANLSTPGSDTIILPSTTPLSVDSSTTALPPVSPSIPGYMPSSETDKLPNDWKNLGIINIPIADLPEPDGVNSQDDFNHHISWEDAKSATLQLPQIQQEVALGKTGDDFYTEDQAAGLDWQHGRKRVYDLYYSNTDPIQVDKNGGQYTINSGRHRIYAAKTLGLEMVPAQVRENKNNTGAIMKDVNKLQAEEIKKTPVVKQTDINSMSGYIPGINSINGLEQTELENQKVKELVPYELISPQTEPLTESAANDLNLAAIHANLTKATRAHATPSDESQNKIANEYFRIRSEITEDVACYRIKEPIRTDAYSVGGHNFPGYDVFGENEVCSVKCYSFKKIINENTGQGELTPRFSQYQTEFMNIITGDSGSNLSAAERLIKIRGENPEDWKILKNHLPKDVAESESQAEMANALSHNSTMRIPEDQLDSVKQNLKNFYYKKLIKDGMDEKTAQVTSELEVNRRILSIDPRYKTEHYQAKAAEVFFNR
jgi:hypothetical protein